MKIVTVVGARPQFIKASVVSRALKHVNVTDEVMVHTGQHFDANMSSVFFEQLGIQRPRYYLDINGGGHGQMTGRMLEQIEGILLSERPDLVVVYGDTNSTIAGALAAAKLNIEVAHVEAGLRSFDRRMPEEINRILTDQISSKLFCPTIFAMNNLIKEGFDSRDVEIYLVGDVMHDAAHMFESCAHAPSGLRIEDKFVLATIHRAENTDQPERLAAIVEAINRICAHVQVIIPLHPRTVLAIYQQRLECRATVIPPVGYFESIWLVKNSGLVLTDSGGLQKEAFFFGKPCVTMRESTEWSELVSRGVNFLVGANESAIVNSVITYFGSYVEGDESLFGGGTAAQKIADCICSDKGHRLNLTRQG